VRDLSSIIRLDSMGNIDSAEDERAFLRGGGAMGELIAAHNWAATPLGPLEAWSSALKTATALVLASPLPMALLVGEAAISIYNDAYAALIGVRHPQALGASSRETWPYLAELTDDAVTSGLQGRRLSFRDLALTVRRKGVPEKVWLNIDTSPVRDDKGVCVAVLSITVETTERVLAERKAALQFERLGSAFDQAPGFICLLGPAPDHVVQYVNEAHRRLFGERHAEGRPVHEVFADILRDEELTVASTSYATGQRLVRRGEPIWIPTADGRREERFVDMVVEPLRDDAGQVSGLYVEGFDVTGAVRAQRAADEAARRLSAAVTLARLGAFELDPHALEVKLDARAREIFGFGPDEPLQVQDLVSRMEPEDVSRLAPEDAAAVAAGQTRREADYRVRLPDGTVRHVRAVGDVTAGPDGTALWSIGLLEDVTERRRAEQRQRMLINELNHRVKNTLATIQSIASQTFRGATDLTSARAAFESRLVALSGAHNLLTAESWRGARLDEVAAHALAPFAAEQAPQISRSGPPAWLPAPNALALSLALHELATNAAKFGALSVPEGRVALSWSVNDGRFVLSWREEGGPPVGSPLRSGFGMRLLQRSLARELNGEVALEFLPTGVRCDIHFQADDCGPSAGAAPPLAGRFWAPPAEGNERWSASRGGAA
jgi:two-component sensor histidine kinase/PAS domain-containing protein